MSDIACVTPTNRPEQIAKFCEAWRPLFEKHSVTLVVVRDGDSPQLEMVRADGTEPPAIKASRLVGSEHADLFCRHTDAVRNYGFVQAAKMRAKYVLTLDDDCLPPAGSDPIEEHLDALNSRVPISWMSAAHNTDYYLRGFPYGIRDEAPVMVSHGVWVKVPDFDGKTQLELQEKRPGGIPYTLPYYVGPIPKGIHCAVSGMNLMVRAKEMLPYLYFAPMGPDSGFPDLHRFADIWCGNFLKGTCDAFGWALYSGASVVLHERQSDAVRNAEQEKLGMEWHEMVAKLAGHGHISEPDPDFVRYWVS